MKIEVSTLSTKGQVVIPQDMREDLKLRKGDQIAFVEERGLLILRPLREVGDEFLDAVLAASGWKEIERGRYRKMGVKKLLAELSKW